MDVSTKVLIFVLMSASLAFFADGRSTRLAELVELNGKPVEFNGEPVEFNDEPAHDDGNDIDDDEEDEEDEDEYHGDAKREKREMTFDKNNFKIQIGEPGCTRSYEVYPNYVYSRDLTASCRGRRTYSRQELVQKMTYHIKMRNAFLNRGKPSKPGNGNGNGNSGSPLTHIGPSQFRQIQDICVDEHNIIRKRYGMPPVVGNAAMSRFSQAKATSNVNIDVSKHSSREVLGKLNYGENLAGGKSSVPYTSVESLVRESVRLWYMEVCYLHGSYGRCSWNGNGIGHMTALLWKGSKEIGCGLQVAKKGMWYKYEVTANYKPGGNMRQELRNGGLSFAPYYRNLPCQKLLNARRGYDNNGKCDAYKKKMG